MNVTLDKTNRFVFTRQMRDALNLGKSEGLEVSINPGAILLTSPRRKKGKLVKKGKLLVYTGEIPAVDIVEAVNRSRR